MGRGTYKRTDMTEPWRPPAEELKPCGTPHPAHPAVKCISTTKCDIDWHVALLNGKLVYFGKAAEEAEARAAKEGRKLAHPVLK